MKKMIITICLLGCFFMATRVVIACTCTGTQTPNEARQYASAVYYGTVNEVERKAGGIYKKAEISISKVWKGPILASASVWTESSTSACGIHVKEGKQRMFYVRERGGVFYAGLCENLTTGKDRKRLGPAVHPSVSLQVGVELQERENEQGLKVGEVFHPEVELKNGDVLTRVTRESQNEDPTLQDGNGSPVTAGGLEKMIRQATSGEQFVFTISRDGETKHITWRKPSINDLKREIQKDKHEDETDSSWIERHLETREDLNEPKVKMLLHRLRAGPSERYEKIQRRVQDVFHERGEVPVIVEVVTPSGYEGEMSQSDRESWREEVNQTRDRVVKQLEETGMTNLNEYDGMPLIRGVVKSKEVLKALNSMENVSDVILDFRFVR